MNRVSPSDARALKSQLWKRVLETVGPLELGVGCAHELRQWITMAVERMENEGRVQPRDLALAEANLQNFVEMMKTEALYLGHADRLDRKTFLAAHRQLERKALLTPVSFWPFWPNEFWKA